MNPTPYLQRTPLLDPQQNVLGYKLGWQHSAPGSAPSAGANLRQLATLVAERSEKADSSQFFLDTGPAALPADLLQSLRPNNTVVLLSQAELVNANSLPPLMSLHAQGFGLALRDVDLALLGSSDGLPSLLTHVELALDHPELTKIVDLAKHARPPLSVLVKKVTDWQEFDACAAHGFSSFFGNLCLTPHQLPQATELGPQTLVILQLMHMVQNNADIRDLEKVFKRDAMLSYKLFRYINSASFGIEVEIESLHHAVTMLGYTPLYHWLSLLLAMTNRAGFSPALLQAAIVRGRFIELLGQKLLSKSEAENLFVVGLFSLLDQLLGVSMEQVLHQISLPTAIAQALLSRDGVYGPFLALAQACELENGGASDLADALFMTAAQVNRAHLSALVWAQNLKI
jgi:c-di-GMP-related signal transduction protein